jgi:hypothetical protein
MFRSNLLKLSVTLVLLVATAFASVTAVAADPWYPTKADDAAFASNWDWVDSRSSSILSSDAAFASDWDWVDRRSSSILSGDAAISTLDNPNGRWIGPETVSAALSPLDNSSGRWIGPETVSAALGQLQP